MRIALKYREERSEIKGISDWKKNRLPVITDVRLTCRLWNPASQCNRLSMIRLTANVVAAQQPTTSYFNKIREYVSQLRETVPECSKICLTEFFDEQITDVIFDRTKGKDENLDISLFASTIDELSEFKAKEQEELTNRAVERCEVISTALAEQTEEIKANAVEKYRNKMGLGGFVLKTILYWPFFVTPIFAITSMIASYITKEWSMWLIVLLVGGLGILEEISHSHFFKKYLLQRILPICERRFEHKILNTMSKTELRYKVEILERIKKETIIWGKCKRILDIQKETSESLV